ncbi:hypothetical protein DFH09DRAFT_1051602 [Mycena vulgaris]|nr:hypothetical protein DFH09DRAFT_1051602 [Mycena vulgaris]
MLLSPITEGTSPIPTARKRKNYRGAGINYQDTAPSGRMWELGEGGQELGKTSPAASEWTECAKATRAFDKEMVGSLRGDMDTLLVFASLFSAVVTAFVIDSYHGLRAASSVDTTILLHQLLLHIQEEAPVINTTSTLPEVSTSSVCINALWFSSLVLSLTTVLGAILAKQWLSEYELTACSTTGTSPREQVALRHLKFDSLRRWGVTTIIDYLPVQLICALFLFFAGLLYLVWTLNVTVAIITSIWVGISVVWFLATTVLPSFFELCAFCSPQSWLFFYLSKGLQRVVGKSSPSEIYSFTDTWIDVFLNALSRPSESRKYEVRGLAWIHAALGSWDSSLITTIYNCTLSLPANDAAKVICRFGSNASSPGLNIGDRLIHVAQLRSAIGPKIYGRLYTALLESILSTGCSSVDAPSIIAVFASLHLVVWHPSEPQIDVEPQILLSGITQLSKILLEHNPSILPAIKSTVAATLFYIGTQEHLDLPEIDKTSIASLEKFTRVLTPNPLQKETPTFLSLSLWPICLRLWSRTQTDGGKERTSPDLTALLSAMQSAVRSGQSSAPAAITSWISVIDNDFVHAMFTRDDKDTIGALQELALCFRKAYDDGIGLSRGVAERIDVLVVHICSPEVVCATFFKATYSGMDDPFSEANMHWWEDRLSFHKFRIFRLLCNHSPLINPPAAPDPLQTAHVRIVLEAARLWTNNWIGSFNMVHALPIVVSCCTMDESDLSLWFPTMQSPQILLAEGFGKIIENTVAERDNKINDPERMLVLASVMQCTVSKLPTRASEDSTLFLSLMSGSLALAALCTSKIPEAELVTQFGNLLDAATSFAQLHSTDDGHVHSKTISHWLVELSRFERISLLTMTPPHHIPALIHAARAENAIKGLDGVENLSQLSDWVENRRVNENIAWYRPGASENRPVARWNAWQPDGTLPSAQESPGLFGPNAGWGEQD